MANFGRNALYRNNGDGTFSDVTEQAGLGDTNSLLYDAQLGRYIWHTKVFVGGKRARAMLARAERRVLVTDATKLGKRGLATVCRYGELNEIVTDGAVPEEEARSFDLAGVTVTVAEA